MIQQSAERFVTNDLIQRLCVRHAVWRQNLLVQRHVAKTLMWPQIVIIIQPTIEDTPQVVLTENPQTIKTFYFYSLIHPQR